MALIAKTNFSGNRSASEYHRILGKYCYYLDIDQIEMRDNSMNEIMKEFDYDDNDKMRTVAMIDWKYPGQSLSDKIPAIKYQIHTSENEYKVPIPFFIIITYLDNNYPIKSYYVIPSNIIARNYFNKANLSINGVWMSLKRFSKFQHALRGRNWNGNERLINANTKAVGLKDDMMLKELSNEYCEYKLPKLDFSWMENK